MTRYSSNFSAIKNFRNNIVEQMFFFFNLYNSSTKGTLNYIIEHDSLKKKKAKWILNISYTLWVLKVDQTCVIKKKENKYNNYNYNIIKKEQRVVDVFDNSMQNQGTSYALIKSWTKSS